MDSTKYRALRTRFSKHTVRRHYTGVPDEVRALYANRPGTTRDALSVVIHMGAICVHSPDLGGLVLQPFAPDPIKWLWAARQDWHLFISAVPDNLRGPMREDAQAWDSVRTIWVALGCVLEHWGVESW